LSWVNDICTGDVRVWLGWYIDTGPDGHGVCACARAEALRVVAKARAMTRVLQRTGFFMADIVLLRC
jgi:hypothetical protein